MAIYLNSQGKEFNLSQKLGQGGEGVVYSCAEDSGLVAKIYHEPVDAAKSVKLRWMAENRDEQLLKISAWVVDVLMDPANGQVAGFLMPSVQAKEIHELYALKSRRVHFPRANWSFLIHAATNIARAFFVLHKHDHVMGDVNHGNCVVLPDGRVRLIDCDSYSIKTDTMQYRCDVGVATHLPPELQGRDLSSIDRTKNHDNFGLSVMIFQLLFLGRHPFAGNFQGSEDKSLEDCIREHRFAYSYDVTATRVSQPPGTLCLDELTPRLSEMFEHAFMSFSRPEADQWVEALEDLSGSLKSCRAHIGHHFYEGLKACPWCRIERRTGVTVFPFSRNDDSLDIFSVESLLTSLNVPEKLPAKLPKAATPSSPSQVILDLQNEELLKFVGFVVVQLVVVVLAAAVSGLFAALFTGLFAATIYFAIIYLTNRTRDELAKEELAARKADWSSIKKEWAAKRVSLSLDAPIKTTKSLLSEYKKLQQAQQKALSAGSDVEKRRTKYLKAEKIQPESFAGLSNEQLTLLREAGIRSANDITPKQLKPIITISDEMKRQLSAWRADLERSFEGQPENQTSIVLRSETVEAVNDERRRVEQKVEKLISELRRRSVEARNEQVALKQKVQNASAGLLQAEMDLKTGNSYPIWVASMFAVGVIFPFLASTWIDDFVESAKSQRQQTVYADRINPVKVEPPKLEPISIDLIITDAEIEKMQMASRFSESEKVRSLALRQLEKSDYRRAEFLLGVARRLDPENVDTINILAQLHFFEKEYKESVRLCYEALLKRPSDEQSLLLLTRNHIALKDFKSALSSAKLNVAGNPSTLEGYRELGIVYQRLKDDNNAVPAFEKHLSKNSTDAEALIGMIRSLRNLGRIDEIEDYFTRLKATSPVRADKEFPELRPQN